MQSLHRIVGKQNKEAERERSMKQTQGGQVDEIVRMILNDYEDARTINKIDRYNQPDKQAILEIVGKLLKILFPGYYNDKVYQSYRLKNNMPATIEDVMYHLNRQITIVLKYCHSYPEETEEQLEERAEQMTLSFLQRIPQIRDYLDTDIQAAYEGDPAAGSRDEIILCYPGFYAITVYRIAHELFLLQVPMIPRIMTEHAHSRTGVDIHPGATIGKYFFMDHGTGIVIGETTVIGEHVKLYQGVTLGALSTKGGQKLKNRKRHPTIKDNVTIYSGASILGGDTVIEENVVVGGNAFITKSVGRGTKVSVKAQELTFRANYDGEL